MSEIDCKVIGILCDDEYSLPNEICRVLCKIVELDLEGRTEGREYYEQVKKIFGFILDRKYRCDVRGGRSSPDLEIKKGDSIVAIVDFKRPIKPADEPVLHKFADVRRLIELECISEEKYNEWKRNFLRERGRLDNIDVDESHGERKVSLRGPYPNIGEDTIGQIRGYFYFESFENRVATLRDRLPKLAVVTDGFRWLLFKFNHAGEDIGSVNVSLFLKNLHDEGISFKEFLGFYDLSYGNKELEELKRKIKEALDS